MLVAFLSFSLISSFFTILLIDSAKVGMLPYENLENLNGVFYNHNYLGGVRWDEFSGNIKGLKNYVARQNTAVKIEGRQQDVSAVTYNSFAESTLKIELLKGEWFSTAVREESIMCAIATENLGYKVGEKYTIYYGAGRSQVGTIKVVGIISDNAAIPSFGNNKAQSLTVLNEKINKETLIIESLFVKNNNLFFATGAFLYFDENLSLFDYNKNLEILRSHGSITDISDLFEGSYKEIEDNKNMIMPFAVLSGVLSIFSLMVVVSIAYDKSKKSLMVLTVCGGRRVHLFLSFLFYYFILSVFVLLFSLIGFYFMRYLGVLSVRNLSYATLMGLGFFGIILICIGLSTVLISKKVLTDSFK